MSDVQLGPAGKLVFGLADVSPPLMSNNRLGKGSWRITARLREEGLVRGRYVRGKLGLATCDGPVDVVLIWRVKDWHRRDCDGPQPTLKAFLDGLVDAKVLSDDCHKVVRRAWCEIEVDPAAAPRVTVEVRPYGG